MPDLAAPDYQFARFVLERGLAALYAIAFVVAFVQFPALAGERGLEPVRRTLALTTFRRAPSLFHLGYSDRLLRAVSVTGIVIAASLLLGLAQQLPLPLTMLAWFALWALYSSIVNVGGTFYSFGWETLLLEAGFLAIFLGNAETPPLFPVMLLFRWLAFRVEFGAGLIKLRGDPCWRALTCMNWHHETQPMPNPLSWFFHHLPRPIHRIEVLGNFAAQLVLPFGLFLPQPGASIAAVLMIGTQLYLVVSGNYAWLNWVTIVALAAAIDDRTVEAVFGFVPGTAAALGATPTWFLVAVLVLTGLVVVLSYFPVRNLLSPDQKMNASFGLFLPQPGASIAAVLMIGTQLYLVVSGNYAWLNWVTIVALAAAIDDRTVEAVFGFVPGTAAALGVTPAWFLVAVLALTGLVLVLSYFPVRNLLSPDQKMNASFDPFRLVNTYGAFGSVSRERYEVVVEGTAESDPGPDAAWHEYEFKGKPGDPSRVPRQFAPYHLRLDWLMWFLPLSRAYGEGWFLPFLTGLLQGDRAVLGLLRHNPFADQPPALVRARLYRYRYTSWHELRASGRWWNRELVGDFLGPVRLREGR